MVSEFVVVWVELNWLRDVAGSAFFVKGTPVRRVLPAAGASSGAGFYAAGNLLKAFYKSPNSRLAAAQTADF